MRRRGKEEPTISFEVADSSSRAMVAKCNQIDLCNISAGRLDEVSGSFSKIDFATNVVYVETRIGHGIGVSRPEATPTSRKY
ncbi:MAG: hypothetical protein BGN99_28170 [Alphaproteobacteria bacterium 65-37]|nr:MAG: hypothetical protein BGN99_28170 [Alphaproteobacteria bacterium 65-37]